MIRFYTAQTTNAVSQVYEGTRNESGTLILSGVWGGAVIKVEVSIDGTDWVVPESGTFSANAAESVQLGTGLLFRLNLINATGTTNLNGALLV